jgi:hypothetical protein
MLYPDLGKNASKQNPSIPGRYMHKLSPLLGSSAAYR